MSAEVGIAVIGAGLMGAVHSRALLEAPTRFGELSVRPRLVVCVDEIGARAAEAQERFGFERATTDWEGAITSNDVDVVVICTPNQSHLALATAAAANGKHVFCEKPVGKGPDQTRAVRDAVADAGVLGFTGFIYRMPPLVRYARRLIQSGAIGEVTHYRGRFNAGYARSPSVAHSWRFDRDAAGYGALGDLMSHVVDMTHFLVGPLSALVARTETLIAERPLSSGPGSHFSLAEASLELRPVTNDDTVGVLGTLSSGAQVILEACRIITGRQCEMAFDVHGTKGAVSWDFERMNELRVYQPENTLMDGWRVIQSGPMHPGHNRFYPGTAVGLGFEDLATLQAAGMLSSLAGGDAWETATLADAASVAAVQEACEYSSAKSVWADVGYV